MGDAIGPSGRDRRDSAARRRLMPPLRAGRRRRRKARQIRPGADQRPSGSDSIMPMVRPSGKIAACPRPASRTFSRAMRISAVADQEQPGHRARPLQPLSRWVAQRRSRNSTRPPAPPRRAGSDGAARIRPRSRRRSAGMCVAEDHAPRTRGRPAPELAVDEVGDAPEEQADRLAGGDQVGDASSAGGILLAPGEHRRSPAATPISAAVEAHAAVPESRTSPAGRPRVGPRLAPLAACRTRVAEPAAEDDAEGDPQDQVVDLRRGQGGPRSPQSFGLLTRPTA